MNNEDKLNSALESLEATFKKVLVDQRKNLPSRCSISCFVDEHPQTLMVNLLLDTDLNALSRRQKEKLQRVKLAFLHQTRDILKQKGLPRILVEVTIKQNQAFSPSQSTIDTLVDDLKIIKGLQGLETAIEVKGKSMPGKYENLVQIVPRVYQNETTTVQLSSLINFMQEMVRLLDSNFSKACWMNISELSEIFNSIGTKAAEWSEQSLQRTKNQQEQMTQLYQYVPSVLVSTQDGVEVRYFIIDQIKCLPDNELTLSYLKSFIDELRQGQNQSQSMIKDVQVILRECDHLLTLLQVAKAFENAIPPKDFIMMAGVPDSDCSIGSSRCNVIKQGVIELQKVLCEFASKPLNPFLSHKIRRDDISRENYLVQLLGEMSTIVGQPQLATSRPSSDHTPLFSHTEMVKFIDDLDTIYQDKKSAVDQLLSQKQHRASKSQTVKCVSSDPPASAYTGYNFFEDHATQSTKEAKIQARRQLDKLSQKALAHQIRDAGREIKSVDETIIPETSNHLGLPLFKIEQPGKMTQTLDSAKIVKFDGMRHVYLSKYSLDDTDLSAFETVLSSPKILGLTTRGQSGLKLHHGKWVSIRKCGNPDRLLCVMIQDHLDCLIVPKQVVSHKEYERICKNHKLFTDKYASLLLQNISEDQEFQESNEHRSEFSSLNP
ncbi:MAG: hypothetical protein VXY77_00270 [Pseudomonadota bacterium]|nr:hypothetical protein [Pseudomonadota bacterium]